MADRRFASGRGGLIMLVTGRDACQDHESGGPLDQRRDLTAATLADD
jgi:hypothetical protein